MCFHGVIWWLRAVVLKFSYNLVHWWTRNQVDWKTRFACKDAFPTATWNAFIMKTDSFLFQGIFLWKNVDCVKNIAQNAGKMLRSTFYQSRGRKYTPQRFFAFYILVIFILLDFKKSLAIFECESCDTVIFTCSKFQKTKMVAKKACKVKFTLHLKK